MTTLNFKCTLLSDVILNMKAATAGPNETLDFIPGSNFLGIVAGALYPAPQNGSDHQNKISLEDALIIFHSGKVRFGDAHPSMGNMRGLKVPASMYYPKLKTPEEELYIHHHIPEDKDLSGIQLKQCRKGFFVFPQQNGGKSSEAELVKTETNFAIKSAYDRETRRSKDEQLFGYQSLQKGLTLYFSVDIDDDAISEDLVNDIKEALTCENKRIGRSRTAEYGLVEITEFNDFKEIPSADAQDMTVAVYADGRLIFLDENGIPTFQPTADRLGLDGEIDWEKSQIRTFRYAPWNFKRQSFDTDRCGIEKGSVIVVKNCSKSNLKSGYVGDYRNEGFGKVIYNPWFLNADSEGLAKVKLSSANNQKTPDKKEDATASTTSALLTYLRQRRVHINVYELVNLWIKNNKDVYVGKVTSSQWGNIREIAQTSMNKGDLIEKLFKEPSKENKADAGYLMHGSESKQWNEKRKELLKTFIDNCDENYLKDAVVNLASQMGKIKYHG